MKIAVIGTGYVGLVSGTCFAEMGHVVTCVDYDKSKIDGLNNGIMPIYEPGLDKMVGENTSRTRLFFTSDIKQALLDADVAIIAVGTPTNPRTNKVDISYIDSAATAIKENIAKDIIVIMKSTVPVGTCARLNKLLNENSLFHCRIVSNPEFLREGHAIEDFLFPERVVIGSQEQVEEEIRKLYAYHIERNVPILFGNFETAELIKYAANNALAAKVALMNEIACISERVGGDINQIIYGVGLDSRIGNKFIYPGPGFGGSCFPKDTKALLQIAEEVDFEGYLIKAITQSNENHKQTIVKNIDSIFQYNLTGKRIAIWGVTYKANTDDIRSSPVIEIINFLLKKGVHLTVYDPQGLESAKLLWGDQLEYVEDMYQAIYGADLLLIATDWQEFKDADFGKLISMNIPQIYDLRNVVEAKNLPEHIKLYKLGINGRA